MSDQIRKLNKNGIVVFAAYLQIMRNGGTDPAPFQLLTDPTFSEDMEGTATVERQVFKDSFERGSYLTRTLNSFDRRQIAYDFRLWSWLTLYFLDDLCPPDATGKREVLEDALYILGREVQSSALLQAFAQNAVACGCRQRGKWTYPSDQQIGRETK